MLEKKLEAVWRIQIAKNKAAEMIMKTTRNT